MSPPAAAATAAGRSHARRPVPTAVPRAPRRVSGPARVPARGSVAVPAPRAAPGASLGLRVARRVAALPDARVLDRLIRGRLWIALLATGLIGIVFMQISLLRLNTGIGRAVQTAQTLDDQNSALRAELSRMAGSERIQAGARAKGFISPVTGQPQFLDARRVDAARAAANITPPAPVRQLPLSEISPVDGGTAGLVPEAAGTTAPATASVDPAAAASTVTAPQATTAAPSAASTVTAPQATAATAPQASTVTAPQATAATAPATATSAAPATAAAPSAAAGGGAAAPLG